METIVLENDTVRVKFAPDFGGKIVSILERRTGVEFLLPAGNPYGLVDKDLRYEDSDLGGFDECLPSISPCRGTQTMPEIPDHGELWHIPWRVLQRSPKVCLSAQGANTGLRLSRCVSLDKSRLSIRYKLANLSDFTRAWLWSSHPLLSVDPGDLILMPAGVDEAIVGFDTTDRMAPGDRISWPRCSQLSATDLSVVPARDGSTAYKLYTSLKHDGWCGLYRKQHDRVLLFRFDPQRLPHVGIWICLGAWPEHGEHKQFTVALEPCTAPCDSLEAAIANGTARYLEAGISTSWELTIEVLKGDLSNIV